MMKLPPSDFRKSSAASALPERALVVGGGIVGLAIAWQLMRRGVGVHLLEKEDSLGRHQSGRNSGVLHAGLYYRPGSMKARLAVRGIRLMTAFCQEHDIPYEVCGKLVVATEEEELPRLRELLERGRANGLRDLTWLEGGAMREREPHVNGLAAVSVPEEGIVDYGRVCSVLGDTITAGGGRISTGAEVLSLHDSHGHWVAETPQGDFEEPYLINAAGLHCDRVHALTGAKADVQILPFRGEYYQLRAEREHLVRHLIYPVPDPAFPFLGVHFTRRIQGGVEAGPNAILALAREGYRKTDWQGRDLLEALRFPGLWRFLARYPRMSLQEVARSLSKSLFCHSLQRLVPELTKADLEPGPVGIRAQAVHRDGTLLQDFCFARRKNALHILNAPSPGATASLAIGEAVLEEIAG